MREIISVHIGQAGIQLGSTCWELFCIEHGIQSNGQISHYDSISGNECINTFYSETNEGKHVPRAAFVDLEPLIINEVLLGPIGQIIDRKNFISGKEDASNNFARGYCSIGPELINSSLEVIRQLAENCLELQGFLIYHSVGGGSGSGLGSLILEKLSEEYSQKTKINFSIYPSAHNSVAIVEPYNAVLSMHALAKNSDAVVILDNEAIYEICKKEIQIPRQTYTNLNRIIAQAISSMTAPMRFNGNLNANLSEFSANLVPSPNLHFLFPSYAPLICKNTSVAEITNSAFEIENAMAKCNPKIGKYLAYTLMYAGDVSQEDASIAIANLEPRNTVEVADWCPPETNWEINRKRVESFPYDNFERMERVACLINNNTAITQVFERFFQKFEMLYTKRAYVFWYVNEGLEEYVFDEAFEDMKAVESDYNSLCSVPEVA